MIGTGVLRRTGHVRALSRAGDGGDRGSLPLAMMVATVGVMLGALTLPMVLTQLNATRTSSERVHALHAAQSGLESALAQIRAANDGAGKGLKAKLPCGPITGTVSAGNNARYSTDIYYFAVDPQSHGDDTTWINANKISCTPAGGAATVPAFALLKSVGSDYASGAITSVPGRALRATYPLHTSTDNVLGGQIHNNDDGGPADLCLDAGSATPAIGYQPTMEVCSGSAPEQQWAYTTNLNIMLVSSKTGAQPKGLCLDGSYPHSFGASVTMYLAACVSPASARQQWSYNDASTFEGNTGGNLDGYCFAPALILTAGSTLDMGKSTCKGTEDSHAWRPSAQVGAGSAGIATGQLVNYEQFGRCMDASLQNGAKNPAVPTHVLAWPCKQAPTVAGLGWNERWNTPTLTDGPAGSLGRITAVDSAHSTTWCLQSPLVAGPAAKVTLLSCPATAPATIPAALKWTVFRDTGSYEANYRVMDNAGNCLQPIPTTGGSSDLITQTCDDSALQKWNAPPWISAAPLKDLGEK